MRSTLHGLSSIKPTLPRALFTLALGVGMFVPALLTATYFDHTTITHQHEYWRLFTAHFSHSSGDHLIWDLAGFTLCAAYLERYSRTLLCYTLLIAIVTINSYLLSPFSNLQYYTGLSGLIYAVLSLGGLLWWRQNQGLIAILPISLLSIKLIAELNSQHALLTSGWEIYIPAHIIGACSGIVVFFASKALSNKTSAATQSLKNA